MDSRRGDFVEAARKSRVITEYRPVSQVQVESIVNMQLLRGIILS